MCIMPEQHYDQSKYQMLASKYRPLLVMYPEIPSGSVRTTHPKWRAGGPPLTHDYHPRDIRLVLENAAIMGKKIEPGDAEIMMDKMEIVAPNKHIDIVVGAGPGDRDVFWKRYASIDKSVSKYAHRCYAYVVREQRGGYKELLAIEYWYAYLYNDWKSVHEMDWEEIVVVLKVDGQKKEEPTACACSAHHGGYRLRWSRIEKSDDSGHRNSEGTHPIIYVAQGSHANYFYGGQSYTTTAEIFNTLFIRSGKFPFTGEFMDFVAYFDEGDRRLIEAVLIPPPTQNKWTGEWRWLNFHGRWGSAASRLNPLIQNAPASLATRTPQWNHPCMWIDEICQEAPGHPTWLLR